MPVTALKSIRSCLAAVVVLAGGGLLRADDLAARVVILANARQPESVQLAEFYAEKRGIPAANILALPLPETEDITWREFIDQVYQPVQDELHRRGWLDGTTSRQLDALGRKRYAFTDSRLAFLVVCRGVPLRIYNDPTLLDEKFGHKIRAIFNKNEAAVDSELSLLGQSGYEITAFTTNPLFNTELRSLDAQMVVKVSRLDGPTLESARHLVTSALEAEAHGLLGRYYVDLGGPDPAGDRWLAATQAQLQRLGFDGDAHGTAGTFGPEARFDAPVLYFGWYAGGINGPFAAEGAGIPPGAIALHIHSFSAHTLRSASAGWCGPLVARGFAATVGNVFEPYLGFTHRPDLLLQALARGRNLGDAAYYALPVLSWQTVLIGDPLYRPFKISLGEQERLGAVLPPALAPYAVMRRANLLWRENKQAAALAALRTGMREQPGLALGLALAKMQLAAGDEPAAVNGLGFATALKRFRPQDWPVVREIAGFLAAHGGRAAALRVYAMLVRTKAPTPEAHKSLLTEARATADAEGDLALSLEFARQLNELAVPPPSPPAAK